MVSMKKKKNNNNNMAFRDLSSLLDKILQQKRQRRLKKREAINVRSEYMEVSNGPHTHTASCQVCRLSGLNCVAAEPGRWWWWWGTGEAVGAVID